MKSFPKFEILKDGGPFLKDGACIIKNFLKRELFENKKSPTKHDFPKTRSPHLVEFGHVTPA